jgi:hypothetical protein
MHNARSMVSAAYASTASSGRYVSRVVAVGYASKADGGHDARSVVAAAFTSAASSGRYAVKDTAFISTAAYCTYATTTTHCIAKTVCRAHCSHILLPPHSLHCNRTLQCSHGGSSICGHGRVRSRCTECGGGSICEHVAG